MPSPAAGLLVIIGVLILPVTARLWRAGRISDRTAAMVVIGWAPVLLLVGGLLGGSSLPILAVATALLVLPGLALRRTVLDLVREQRNVH